MSSHPPTTTAAGDHNQDHNQNQTQTHPHHPPHLHHIPHPPSPHPTSTHPPPSIIPTLHPPELFSTLHPYIYRCSNIDPLTSGDFLRTLSLRTILTLTIEKPRSPLRNLASSLNIALIHSALWLSSPDALPTSFGPDEPAWRQAVDEALGYLRPQFRPVLVVDAVGVFCGVVRRAVMNWNVTGTVLEYRSFFPQGGGAPGGRYGSEEVVEMVGGEGWEVLEGLEDLVPGWEPDGEGKDRKEREEDGGEAEKRRSEGVGSGASREMVAPRDVRSPS